MVTISINRVFSSQSKQLALCIVAIVLSVVRAVDDTQFPLNNRSFRVKSVIKSIGDAYSSGNSEVLRVTEDYSYEQKRARIQYYSSGADSALRKFYYNDNAILGIQHKMDPSSEDTCKKASKEDLTRDLYRNFKGLNVFMDQFNNAQNGHIVGPTRLLFVIAARGNQMRKIETNNSQKIFGGDQELYQYELDISLGPGQDKQTISVFYDAVTFAADFSPESQLPKLISMPFFSLVIKYSLFEMLLDSKNPQSERTDANREIVMDHYTFPTSTECSGQLPGSNLFFPYSLKVFEVSFSAFSHDALGIVEEHTVEFDGVRQVLRIDKHNYENDHSTSDIFDLRADRRYMVNTGDSNEEGRCIMVRNMGARRVEIEMADLLAGGKNFSLLGRAKVRGIDALVYSVEAPNLPYWYDKPLVYSRDEWDRLRQRGHSVYDVDRKYYPNYHTLLYVHDTIEDGAKLLAMEVMQANNMHLLRVDFFDFIWKLSRPPDQLKTGEFFTPIESCSAGGARDDNYIDVSMMLVQEMPEQAESMKQQQQIGWINNRLSRDAALLASISDSLGADVTMIHDFESTSEQFGGQFKINVDFRLSERPIWLHMLKYIGGASLRPTKSYIENSHLLIKRSAQTLRDCLDLMNPADNLTYIYYSELDSICILDPTLIGVSEGQLLHFDLLNTQGKQAIGELYQVSIRGDSLKISTTLLRDEAVQMLEDRLLILSHFNANPAMPMNPREMRVRIKQVKLRNVNYQRTEKVKRGTQTGYALVSAGSAGGGSYIVESMISQEEEPQSLADCQTACMADLSCETYSFCVYFPETECTLSNATYQSIEIEIERRENAKEIQQEKPSLKLRKDFHCEIHQNHHLDYFFNRKETFIHFEDLQFEPVNNIEDCARVCLKKTIKELQRQLDLQEKMHGSSDTGIERKSELIDEYKEQMRRLCHQLHYVSTPTEKDVIETVRHYLSPESKQLADSHKGGYCLLNPDSGTSNESDDKNAKSYQNKPLKVESFELDFSKLYKREPGFSLVKPEATKEEQDAIVSYAHTKSEQSLKVLRQLDLDGRNLQNTFLTEMKHCARACFEQYHGLCRSFDTYRERLMSGRSVIKCNLNSQSIRKYKQAGMDVETLKDTKNVNRTHIYHYELKWDLIVRPLARMEESDPSSQAKPSANFGPPMIFLIIVASLLCGLAFGLKLGQRLLPAQRQLDIPIIVVDPTTNNSELQPQQDDEESLR